MGIRGNQHTMDRDGKQLSVDFRAHLRLFAFYLSNGSLELQRLEDLKIHYPDALAKKGDLIGRIFAVYLNNLEVGVNGELFSDSHAVYRAQQRASELLITFYDLQYQSSPPISEIELQVDGSKVRWKDEIKGFALTLGEGLLEPDVLGGIDYVPHLWDYEIIFAIFSNVLRIDTQGVCINADLARHRAAQCVRQYADRSYVVAPPFEGWEVELAL